MKKAEIKNVKPLKNGVGSTIEKNKYTEHLGNVYKDINAIEINAKDSFETLLKKFYAVMTKWNICQGNWEGNGRSVSSPEWCMCWNTYKNKIDAQFMWMSLMAQPPKHLLAYGKKPKAVSSPKIK